MQFASAEEFALWVEQSEPKPPRGSDDSSTTSPRGRTSPGAEWTRPFEGALRRALQAATSPTSRRSRDSRSPSEYSACSTDAEDDDLSSRSPDSIEVLLRMDYSVQRYIEVSPSEQIHSRVREALGLPSECRMHISFAGEHVAEEQATFKNCGICSGNKLDVFFLPEVVQVHIAGSGSLGLSFHPRHEPDHRSGVGEGAGLVELGKVEGPAARVGLMAGDVLIKVNSEDVRLKPIQEVQQLFGKIKAEQLRNPSDWKGCALTVERHRHVAQAKALMLIEACKAQNTCEEAPPR